MRATAAAVAERSAAESREKSGGGPGGDKRLLELEEEVELLLAGELTIASAIAAAVAFNVVGGDRKVSINRRDLVMDKEEVDEEATVDKRSRAGPKATVE